MESHSLFHDYQRAYQSGRSSEQILLFAVDTIVHALDRVCFDLRKTFDFLNHVILLERLQKMGVCDVELKWLQNYLSDHFQRVKCGATFSDWGPVKGGIPQGSALGPLLFLIYVNDMPVQVKHGPLLQFADDTCLVCCGNTNESVSKMLSDDLSSLYSWIAASQCEKVQCDVV